MFLIGDIAYLCDLREKWRRHDKNQSFREELWGYKGIE